MKFRIATLAAFFCLSSMPIGSETLTLTTTYPSPMGVYKTLISTDKTLLAQKTGKVGIGTATPSQLLDVNGNANVSGNLTMTGSFGIGTTTPAQPLDVNGSAAVRGTLFAGFAWTSSGVTAGNRAIAQCPAGTMVVSGGCVRQQGSGGLNGSFPNTGTSWQCEYDGNPFTGAPPNSVVSWALCARVGQ